MYSCLVIGQTPARSLSCTFALFLNDLLHSIFKKATHSLVMHLAQHHIYFFLKKSCPSSSGWFHACPANRRPCCSPAPIYFATATKKYIAYQPSGAQPIRGHHLGSPPLLVGYPVSKSDTIEGSLEQCPAVAKTTRPTMHHLHLKMQPHQRSDRHKWYYVDHLKPSCTQRPG